VGDLGVSTGLNPVQRAKRHCVRNDVLGGSVVRFASVKWVSGDASSQMTTIIKTLIVL